MVIEKSLMTKKINFASMKSNGFLRPLFFEKRDNSLVGPLYNPDRVKSEISIFSKNLMLGKSKVPKCDS